MRIIITLFLLAFTISVMGQMERKGNYHLRFNLNQEERTFETPATTALISGIILMSAGAALEYSSMKSEQQYDGTKVGPGHVTMFIGTAITFSSLFLDNRKREPVRP